MWLCMCYFIWHISDNVRVLSYMAYMCLCMYYLIWYICGYICILFYKVYMWLCVCMWYCIWCGYVYVRACVCKYLIFMCIFLSVVAFVLVYTCACVWIRTHCERVVGKRHSSCVYDKVKVHRHYHRASHPEHLKLISVCHARRFGWLREREINMRYIYDECF